MEGGFIVSPFFVYYDIKILVQVLKTFDAAIMVSSYYSSLHGIKIDILVALHLLLPVLLPTSPTKRFMM